MSFVEECFAIVPCEITVRDWSRISTGIKWLEPISKQESVPIPGTARIAAQLVEILSQLITTSGGQPLLLDAAIQEKVNSLLTAFHNTMESGAQDIYAFLVSGVGAYSASALLEDATVHLSALAQTSLPKTEKRDFQLSGACLAVRLPTAAGFHAMRALEAEARRYHKVATGVPQEVDWNLSHLVNGNSGKGRVGLRDQWKKEGAKDDSPLLLIISLLTSVTQIYRNPVMHPEMTLTPEQGKQVFDTAALVVSAMVEDRVNRQKP